MYIACPITMETSGETRLQAYQGDRAAQTTGCGARVNRWNRL